MCVDVEPLSTVDRVTVYDWMWNGEVGMTPLSPEFVKGTDSECEHTPDLFIGILPKPKIG